MGRTLLLAMLIIAAAAPALLRGCKASRLSQQPAFAAMQALHQRAAALGLCKETTLAIIMNGLGNKFGDLPMFRQQFQELVAELPEVAGLDVVHLPNTTAAGLWGRKGVRAFLLVLAAVCAIFWKLRAWNGSGLVTVWLVLLICAVLYQLNSGARKLSGLGHKLRDEVMTALRGGRYKHCIVFCHSYGAWALKYALQLPADYLSRLTVIAIGSPVYIPTDFKDLFLLQLWATGDPITWLWSMTWGRALALLVVLRVTWLTTQSWPRTRAGSVAALLAVIAVFVAISVYCFPVGTDHVVLDAHLDAAQRARFLGAHKVEYYMGILKGLLRAAYQQGVPRA